MGIQIHEPPMPYRMRQHDDKAVPIVINEFRRYGFEAYQLGTESDSEELRKALMQQSDKTSLMLRFRPDTTFIRAGTRSILCEIKSEAGRYPNFAIEVDSYSAALQWNMLYKHVMYAFVDLGNMHIYCCWADDVPSPQVIRIPKRWDYSENMRRLETEWPNIRMITEDFQPAPEKSGTPYFLLPKRSSVLQPFDVFVSQILAGNVTQLELIP